MSPQAFNGSAVNGSNGHANGHDLKTTRGWKGKYIEQNEEQTVLQSLGSAVLAKHKMATKQKSRAHLENNMSEAERRLKRAQNQHSAAQLKLDKLKGRLTRDSAFERKGLEALLTRLNNTIKGEQRQIEWRTLQIAETDASLEELARRAGHLAA
ncbi:uncharacterized protein LOC119109088 [Pollicipes pollicipes]|uniref:uncharacterized protein LOC119109088 n=1 Tax=Pollicipes pollicipes TaxID=41117 RepID=UPI0018856BE6|nr:uncharacterized protein LOC119109088 [Pollicipes pollicipes]